MMKRREVLKFSAGAGAAAALTPGRSNAQLCDPDGRLPVLDVAPSPPVEPFTAPLFRMPVAQPRSVEALTGGPPDPNNHQRYLEFEPVLFYEEHMQEFRWSYHPAEPYNQGSWHWGFDGISPGYTYHARYGEPILLRRFNDLPPVGMGEVNFALPSTTIHLHNAHTASESDGIPQDYFNPGEFKDYHYGNFPAGFDEREIMSTLWYHDHRLDFTAPNVYAGLTGFYLLFDELDSNNELDDNPNAFRLPSGDYDVPLILHDVLFDQQGQVVFDRSLLNGWLGDKITVNRTIEPYLEVERRKYRFRILNGGPSRFYQLFLDDNSQFLVLSTDGNLLREPIAAESLTLGVAERHDVILDFSGYNDGDELIIYNRMEQTDGAGPTGRLLDPGMPVIKFKIRGPQVSDPSRIPDFMRELPPINFDEVRRERLFTFDYDGGLWTINEKIMDENRVDAAIEQGTAEIWTLRNEGTTWSHPIHTHFEEFQFLEVNGVPVPEDSLLRSRKDVVRLGPGDEVKFFGRWRDFFGPHVMHCHNVVHEDHAMMLRWDIVPPGEGD